MWSSTLPLSSSPSFQFRLLAGAGTGSLANCLSPDCSSLPSDRHRGPEMLLEAHEVTDLFIQASALHMINSVQHSWEQTAEQAVVSPVLGLRGSPWAASSSTCSSSMCHGRLITAAPLKGHKIPIVKHPPSCLPHRAKDGLGLGHKECKN